MGILDTIEQISRPISQMIDFYEKNSYLYYALGGAFLLLISVIVYVVVV